MIGGLVLAFLVLVAVVTAISALNLPGGLKLYVVQTGSMAPTIPTGSIVLVKPQSSYKPGEVITFGSPQKSFTHRIVEVLETGYITKGDANPSADSNPVEKGKVLGRVIFSAPLLGYPVAFAKTVLGLILLIVVPATILIYSEALILKKEVRKVIKKRKKLKEQKENVKA